MTAATSDDGSKRLLSVDVLRVLAMLMVVAIHTVLVFTLRTDFFATKLWFALEPLVAFSKIGVALFFMTSGFLVITKNRSIRENWVITKQRLLIPLIVFSLLTLGYELYRFSSSGNAYGEFWQKQLATITTFPNSPLWFLVVLLFLYLLNPVWQLVFSKERNLNLALYLTKLALIFSVFVTLIKFPSQQTDVFFNSFTLWLGYVFFYLYGGLVRNNWVSFNRMNINVLMVVLGLTAIILGDYYTLSATVHAQPFVWSGYFFEYLSIPIIILAVGMFNLCMSSDFPWLRNNRIGTGFVPLIRGLAGVSYAIYLLHPLVVSVVYDAGFIFDSLGMNVYLYNFLHYFLVLSISATIGYLILKIAALRWMVGGRR